MFVIKRIIRFNKSAFSDLNKLFLQLSSVGYQMAEKHFKKVLKNKNTHIIVLYDGKLIVGTITLIEMHKMRVYRGSIEDFVIDKNYRGRGLGKKLLLHAISLAKKLGIKRLTLTSEPERKIANMLYPKLGFKIKKTNFYELVV